MLREAIAGSLAADFGLRYNADEIIVTAGVQESIMLCMLGLVNPGDEVLITSPRFTTYDMAVQMCGGVPVPVPTYEEDDFALMQRPIAARITPRTKVLVLVTPNNPTRRGQPRRTSFGRSATWSSSIISSSSRTKSMPSSSTAGIQRLGHHAAGAAQRTITLNGFSKAYAMTGSRRLSGCTRGIQPPASEPRHTLSINANTAAQSGALAAITGPQDAVEAIREEYAEQHTYMMEALSQMGLTYGHPGGAFYIYTNVSSTGLAAPEFCMELLRKTGVMIFPGELFGDDSGRYVRISYLQPLPRIREAVDRMGQFMGGLK